MEHLESNGDAAVGATGSLREPGNGANSAQVGCDSCALSARQKRQYLEEFAQIFAPGKPPHGWDKLLDEDTDDDAASAVHHSAPTTRLLSESTHAR